MIGKPTRWSKNWCKARPQWFHGWTEAEFDEIYSRFGMGGVLTQQGALETVASMNRRRELIAKVKLLWETGEAELLESMIEVLYRRVVITAPDRPASEQLRRGSQDGDSIRDVTAAGVDDAQLIGGAGGNRPT